MKTYMANPDKIERKWYVVDAEGQTLSLIHILSSGSGGMADALDSGSSGS